MKKFNLLVVLLLSTITFAQNAKGILDKVSANYKNKKSYYIKFKSELNNEKTNTKDNYSGEIYIKKEKYNLSIPKMGIQQIYTGDKLYSINNEMEEITVTKPEKNSTELFTPTRVLDIYKTGFNLSIDGKENTHNKTITKIKLIPINQKNLRYIIVGVNQKDNTLHYLQEVDNNNTKTTFTVEKQLSNIIIPKSLLIFNKKFYKNYYISEI